MLRSLANGRYVLERPLGGGGMATVYLGRDAELDRPVAVKVLATGLAGDPDLRARFVREARLAARLAHPNVVTVFDTGEEDGLPYIVMEVVQGETLADRLRREAPLPPEEVVAMALQACAGLEHAHAAGLVHRDVKPANLLLRDDGAVKIADFGIARAGEASRMTQIGTILGTAAYLAPEQARGGEVTPATDVYSLGAVLYECLTGRPPYTFESLAELGRKQAEEPITAVRNLAPDVPPALEDAVMHALARVPEYRPASAAALAHELAATGLAEAATEPMPVPTLATRTPARYAPLRRGRVAAAGLGALALIAAAVALGLGLAGDGDGGAGTDTTRTQTRAEPVSPTPGATPEETARNLADWLRDNTAP